MSEVVKHHSRDDVLTEQNHLKQIAQDVLAGAKERGATAAEVAASIDLGFTVSVRQGEVDTLEHHRDKGIGVTVYFGQRKGSASSSDTRLESLDETIQAACDIAQFTNEDSYAGLADKDLMAFEYPDLDLYHPWDIKPDQAIEIAKACEAHGFAYDKRITNSEGASISSHQGISVYANSHGFIGIVPSSRHSMSCVLIGKEGASMQRDYGYTIARDATDLWTIQRVAEEAGKRTVSRLGARRLATCKVPVIFQADIARELIGNFVAAIRGGNLYRRSSFLLDHLGKQVLPSKIQIKEQPHLKKALGSAPFDSEGVVTQERLIVKDGILQSYVLDSYAARKLGMQTTGNSGGVHNLSISTSDQNLAGLVKQMQRGLIVTELMGQGVNIVTGDYSRGACGFWVENGQIQYPVEEITIAGNLKDMLLNMVAVGNDIDTRGGILTGSILLEEMVIAGQ